MSLLSKGAEEMFIGNPSATNQKITPQLVLVRLWQTEPLVAEAIPGGAPPKHNPWRRDLPPKRNVGYAHCPADNYLYVGNRLVFNERRSIAGHASGLTGISET